MILLLICFLSAKSNGNTQKMFGEEGRLTNEELEFISEETPIEIIPKLSMPKLNFITVRFPLQQSHSPCHTTHTA